MENLKRVLIIEDDPDIVDLIEIHLKDLGLVLDKAFDGQTGLEKALSDQYDMIVLDLMLPKLDGFEVCKKIRSNQNNIPILMLTSRTEELDKVLGLELGADDYLTKPFSIRELIARIKAILRRVEINHDEQQKIHNGSTIEIGQLHINVDKRQVKLDDQKIDLTAKEFDLLVQFANHPGRTYNRQELLDLVWGYHFDGYDHTVNSHINRLRAKLESDPANPVYIKTVWGVGYRFAEAEELEK